MTTMITKTYIQHPHIILTAGQNYQSARINPDFISITLLFLLHLYHYQFHVLLVKTLLKFKSALWALLAQEKSKYPDVIV